MTVKRTEQYRYRVHTRLFRAPLLVLQIQFKGDYQTWWQDAKPEDITQHGLTITFPEKDNG